MGSGGFWIPFALVALVWILSTLAVIGPFLAANRMTMEEVKEELMRVRDSPVTWDWTAKVYKKSDPNLRVVSTTSRPRMQSKGAEWETEHTHKIRYEYDLCETSDPWLELQSRMKWL